MKKLFFFLLFFPVYMMAQKTAPGFTIDGKLDGVDDGTKISFTATARIDTPNELDYFVHGGILVYMLRQLAQKQA